MNELWVVVGWIRGPGYMATGHIVYGPARQEKAEYAEAWKRDGGWPDTRAMPLSEAVDLLGY